MVVAKISKADRKGVFVKLLRGRALAASISGRWTRDWASNRHGDAFIAWCDAQLGLTQPLY